MVATEVGYLRNPPRDVPTTNEVAEPPLTARQRGAYPATYKFGAGYNPHNCLDIGLIVRVIGASMGYLELTRQYRCHTGQYRALCFHRQRLLREE